MRPPRPGAPKQRGMALLMVLALLALLGTVVTDFQYSSQVDIALAYHARDELQAEYNALSALRLRALILKQARKVQALVSAIAQGSGAPPMQIGAILEMIPVECGLMSAITKRVDRDGTAAGGKDEDFFPGECMATSESEHSKIAINLLANGYNQRGKPVGELLLAMFSDARLRKHFEQDDRSGQHAESPLALLGALTDWVDADHSQQGSLGDEDRYYQYGRDPYRAKNAPFDSVAELQLVHGINDALFEALKGRISVYNTEPVLELATAPLETILFVGLPAILKDGVSPDVLVPALPQLAREIAAGKQLGMSFMPLTLATFRIMLDRAGLAGRYDPQRLQTQFTDRSSTVWYTILAQGSMGKATRKIRAVFQAMEGTFYYARMD